MSTQAPLLTIAIPTWNRATYLALNLKQLGKQLLGISTGKVEIIVSNNASTDNTAEVVSTAIAKGMPIRSIVNQENIGSDGNYIQCYSEAKGKYVLILGDDDLFIDGALAELITHLEGHDYGVVTLRPYGYNQDFRAEYPGGSGRIRLFINAPEFLAAIGPLITLFSSCVINKDILKNVDPSKECGSNLVQVYLVLQAALAAKENLYLYKYLIAYKRNNSGGYDFFKIFITQFTAILDRYKSDILNDKAIQKIENNFLLSYYPSYLFRQLHNRTLDRPTIRSRFEQRFKGRLLYEVLIKPTLVWPRPLALLWGAWVTAMGRIVNGDLRRGIMFAIHKLLR